MDNCEHVVDAVAELVNALLRACPELRILATSQSRMGLAGEATWPVPPLVLPPPDARDPRVVAEAESVLLFCGRAALARPGFGLAAGNVGAVSEICRRLDRIPLAIELAAARVNALTAGQLAARLDDRFRLLAGASRGGLPRHRTLRAAIEWSYDLLSEAEQICLRRLAVFAAGCTLEAAEAVCPGGLLAPEQVFQTVTSLVDRSLLSVKERLGSMRYGMLDFDAARAFHRRSLELAEAVGERRCVAESLEEIAEVDAAEGNAERAAMLFGASQALRKAIGSPIPGPDLARFKEAVAATELALGAERFSAAQAAGQAMPVDQAAALARETSKTSDTSDTSEAGESVEMYKASGAGGASSVSGAGGASGVSGAGGAGRAGGASRVSRVSLVSGTSTAKEGR